MIGQYLSNTNENATIFILQIYLELNKTPFVCCIADSVGSSLLSDPEAQMFGHGQFGRGLGLV